ncbi:uncharacterized protein LOC113240102 [Hyposmocoma kahamanoa]|uniref:uncharacterized protein LOC113240102 n=1 Tax=Hyposmocoma kahamanoa TaxID=1477025 RepID=UPI000E6D9C17|nr:uncharacterized protein LOC113240102 [Hyposmocoma kahamanoa]
MPPKRNVEQTSAPNKNILEKPPRKRAKREKVEKPKLRTPTVIKLKIPVPRKSQNVVSPIKEPELTPKKKRRLSPIGALRRKIELANEVALAQLVKPGVNESPKVPPVEEPKKPKRALRKPKANVATKGKTKKSKDIPEIVTDCASDTSAEPVQDQKPAKRVNKKLATPRSDAKPKVTNKQMKKADSTSKKPRKQVKEIHNKETKLQNTDKKPRTRGNALEEVTSTDIPSSPSLLDNKQKTVHNDIKPTNTEMTRSAPKSPLPIDSRKTSTSECLSWTKDISSSSTTTCVTVDSNDFYRIDKKIPVLRLSHVDNKWRRQYKENDDCCSNSDSETSDIVTKYTSSYSHSSRSLDLSSDSSYTHQSNFQSSATKDEICKFALEKLSSQLKKLDFEFVNWIGHDTETVDAEIKMIQGKMFKILKEENEAITLCRNIKKLFTPVDNSLLKGKNECDLTESSNELLERANKELNNTIDRSEDDEFTSSRSRYVMFDQNCQAEEDPLQEPKVTNDNSEGDDNFISDKVQHSEDRYMSFEETPYNDDDDALSLFAESLTGIESSRLNSSASMSVAASEHEEYIPQPLTKDFVNLERHIYQPTKIAASERVQNFRIEKQNADSTYRETDCDVPRHPEVRNKNLKLPICPTNCTTPSNNVQRKLPSIFDTTYRTPPSTRSVVFKGVCFYNLISNCMKARCVFPHNQISENEVKNILTRLNEYVFVQEYMIMRNWPVLRRKFGLLYVEECQARHLTGTLLEMTIDFISKAKFDSIEDLTLKVNVSELTLLHLNTVDLNDYCQILKHNFGQDILLCDVLMHTIAVTQNFSRFKLVFINLTNYVIEIGRKFRHDVASQILERVCILPSEKPLALAVVKIIQNTDASILNNSMIEQFEKQLLSLDKKLSEELLLYKSQSRKNYTSPLLSQESDQISLPHSDRENRYTSPDTTKLDMIKAIKEPVIKRTINLPQMAFSPQCQIIQRSIKPGWRSNNYGRHGLLLRPPMPIRVPGPTRHVAFGSPPKFPRRSGPDFT